MRGSFVLVLDRRKQREYTLYDGWITHREIDMSDAVYFEAMMYAVFLDWLDMELGYSTSCRFAQNRVEESFAHYSWLATYRLTA